MVEMVCGIEEVVDDDGEPLAKFGQISIWPIGLLQLLSLHIFLFVWLVELEMLSRGEVLARRLALSMAAGRMGFWAPMF